MSHSIPISTPSTAAPDEKRPVPPALVAVGFVLMAVSFMINAMDRQVFYPLLPEIRAELGISLSQGGLLATGFTLGLALAGIPAGYLVDRYSRKTVLLVSILIYSVGTLATPLAGGFADMGVYRVLSGAGEGMQAAALYAAIGAFFFLRRSLAFGTLGVAFGLGVFVGPLIGTDLSNAYQSWRAPFIAFGIVGLAVMVLIALFVGKRLTDTVAGNADQLKENYDYLPSSAYNRNTIALSIAAAAGGMVFYGFLGLYATYLRSELHFSVGQAAFATSMVGAGATMSLPTGWLGDRFDQRKLLIITYIGVAVSGWLLFNGSSSPGYQYVLSFVMGTFAAGSLFTNVNSAMQRSVRPNHVGRTAGLFIFCYYIAAAISGFVFAELVDAVGWKQAALWQLTILPLLALVALWFIDPAKIITSRNTTRSRSDET